MTKLSLSPEEMLLVNNSEWILNKHLIIQKVYRFFGDLLSQYQEEVNRFHYLFPENIRHQTGKISKGENYKLLPYVILDYPAFFWKDNIFAVRTMFWWGNFFSITLHLSGNNKIKFTSQEDKLFTWLKVNDYYLCHNEAEWEHHFGEDNYCPAALMDKTAFHNILSKNFFKISRSLPLTQWDNARSFLIEGFRDLMQLLELNYQAGEKDL